MLVTAAELSRLVLDLAPSLRGASRGFDLATPERAFDRIARGCAACEAMMRPVLLAGIAIERCDAGAHLWFDAGEIDQVEAQAEQQQRDAEPGLFRRLLDLVRW